MEIVSALGAFSFFIATYFLSEGRIFKKIVMGIIVVAFLAGLPFVAISAFHLLQYLLNGSLDMEAFRYCMSASLISLFVIVIGFYILRKD
ncbi:hypothetical protein [Pseudochryseolinea flava]|uniref:Uncharacterized protein n=1 Tax=Pseudochryseolinea flava TaxID=2059302 RepID=A0A364Y1S9_9BACT|nr:hypothetical protein [Pseudochryseolinea flava]RAW00617.1 hypothetical protein DQQ10_13570 [Pseudochryseolinea flava]